MLEIDYQNYAPDLRSTIIANTIDIERIRKTRRQNAEILINALGSCDKVRLLYKSVKSDECPLFVPVMIRNERNAIRRHLIKNSIYMPVHWPVSAIHRLNTKTRKIYDEEMSFVCDQRYSKEDMEHIVETIIQYE